MGDQDTLDKLVAEKAEGGFTKREKADIGKQARKLEDVSVNLSYARLAVSVVKQKVPLVANWDEILHTSAEGIYRIGSERAKSQKDEDKAVAASKAAWNKADKCVYQDLRRNPEWERINSQVGGVQNLQDIQILSDLAEQHGCGNCGELTAATFMLLYNLDIRPLDFMALKFPADHAFVVIGRAGSDKDETPGRNWGESAVICDPWASGLYRPLGWPWDYAAIPFGDTFTAYSAALLEQNMNAMHKSFSGVTLVYREE
jgi:hypothetical protein